MEKPVLTSRGGGVGVLLATGIIFRLFTSQVPVQDGGEAIESPIETVEEETRKSPQQGKEGGAVYAVKEKRLDALARAHHHDLARIPATAEVGIAVQETPSFRTCVTARRYFWVMLVLAEAMISDTSPHPIQNIYIQPVKPILFGQSPYPKCHIYYNI